MLWLALSCATTSFPDGLMAGIWDSNNTTCECWYIGDLNYYDLPAADPGVTFIDFYEAWTAGGRPPKAQNWGVFTCPEGASSGGSDGGRATWCGPLSVEPAKPALAELGIIGGCWGFCSEYPGAQWVLSTNQGDCSCYGDLAGLKVTLNYSSPCYVIDYYDFMPYATTSTTSATRVTTSSRSATSNSAKSTYKSSSSTTAKQATKSTSSSTHTTKTTSSISSKTSSRPASLLKSTTSKISLEVPSSSKTTAHSTSISSSKTLSIVTPSTKTTAHLTSTSTSK